MWYMAAYEEIKYETWKKYCQGYRITELPCVKIYTIYPKLIVQIHEQ